MQIIIIHSDADHIRTFIQDILYLDRRGSKFHLTAFNPAHIKDIVDQAHKVITCRNNPLKVIFYIFLIIDLIDRKS